LLYAFFQVISKFQHNANSECNLGRHRHHLVLERSYHIRNWQIIAKCIINMTYDCKQYIMQFNLFAIKLQCKICGIKFKTNAELTQHHRGVHSNISR
jgi:hypothetical protein